MFLYYIDITRLIVKSWLKFIVDYINCRNTAMCFYFLMRNGHSKFVLLYSHSVDFMFQGKKLKVVGRFVLSDPWWEISCPAQYSRKKLVVKSYLQAASYRLQTNNGRSFVPLFLKKCGVDSEFVTRFMEWLPEDRCVDLESITEALSNFGDTNQDVKSAADYANVLISSSGEVMFCK